MFDIYLLFAVDFFILLEYSFQIQLSITSCQQENCIKMLTPSQLHTKLATEIVDVVGWCSLMLLMLLRYFV